MSLIVFLQKQTTIRLWLFTLIISVVMSEIITCLMSFLFQGSISYDYLLTALVASFSVAVFVTSMLIFFLTKLREETRQLHKISETSVKSEERAREAIRASHSALWDVDLTTGQVFLTDGWSPFLCGEKKPTYTTLQALNQLVPLEEHPILDRALIAALKGQNGSTYQVTHRVKKLDGNFIWVLSEGQVTERDQNGRALRMTGINRDITELKLAEDKIKAQLEQITHANTCLLEANSKLEHAQNQLLQSDKMASIGLLASGIAHEINNPIAYVNSNFGTLKKHLASILLLLNQYEKVVASTSGHNPEHVVLAELKENIRPHILLDETRSLLQESQEGLDRVKKIILDLKVFSYTGNEEQWVWADLQQGLETTLNVVWNELKYKCEIIKGYSPIPKVYCLPSRLNQVFMNLLVNAAQAIKTHGTVTLRTGHTDNQVWVEVADSGSGIEPVNLKRIFEPFFTTKPVGKGTGLGLSVSYGIVANHHGRIDVSSTIGKGSIFRVWIPIEQPVSKPASAM